MSLIERLMSQTKTPSTLFEISLEKEPWREDAACKEMGSDIFFLKRAQNIDSAKAICDPCPVREDCLDSAITNGEQYGIWGGSTPVERRNIVRVRNITRSAKS